MSTSTSLAVYQRIADPISGAAIYGKEIAKSRLCNCENESQGIVLAMECFARGVTALQLAEDYHIIEGKLSMRADAMLAGFNERGGKFRVVNRTADCAEIELTLDGQTIVEKLTWEEAQQEPHPFTHDKAGKKILKKNWATPRARRQMLWARVVSEGVRTLCPGVNRGRYTPEEVEDFDGETNGHANGNGHAKPAAKTTVTTSTAREVATDVAADANVVDVPFEEASDIPASDGAVVYCSADQSTKLKELWGQLGVSTEDRAKQLAKRGVQVCRSLTAEQAAELIGKLEAVAAKANEPCPPELVEQIKSKLAEVNQAEPGIVEKIKAKLAPAGYTKIAELTRGDAQSLLAALTGNTMQAFFGVSLWPSPKPKEPNASKN